MPRKLGRNCRRNIKAPEITQIDPKDIEYYAGSLAAWFNTRLELDKSLLTVSTGGIALLLTLLSLVAPTDLNKLIGWLYIIAILAYLITIGLVLKIFNENSNHIIAVLSDTEDPKRTIEKLDRTAHLAFFVAILSTGILATFVIINKLHTPEIAMKDSKKVPTQAPATYGTISMDSFDTMRMLSPMSLKELKVLNSQQTPATAQHSASQPQAIVAQSTLPNTGDKK